MILVGDKFYFDPIYGEKKLEEEEAYSNFIAKLPEGRGLKFTTGYTRFVPNQPLIVGHTYDIALTYYDTDQLLEDNSTVKFSIPRTWTQPQTEDENSPGFVKVLDKEGHELESYMTHNRNLQWWINVKNTSSDNDVIKVHYKDVTIQRFPQREYTNWRSSMRVIIDYKSDGDYKVVHSKATQKPIINAAPAAWLNTTGPATVKPGEDIKIKFSALDFCNNRSFPYKEHEVFAFSTKDPAVPIGKANIKKDAMGYGEVTVKAPKEGNSCEFVLFNRQLNLKGVTNEIVLDHEKEMNVYFGDTHAKTNLSDGLNSPMDYFKHAKEVALLDFAAIADHNCVEASYIEGPFTKQMSDEAYEQIQAACEAYNKPGNFVTIQAFEQNILRDYVGHRNIYFRGIAPGLFRGETLAELYDYLEGHEALVIPHHHIIWGTQPHLDNDKYSRVIEMYSMHCTSEDYDSAFNNYLTSPRKAETGLSAIDILNKGYKVGFISSSDNHNGAPGLSATPSRFTNLVYSGGLAAVLAPELTREAIYDGMYHRRCYATSGARIFLDFRIDGQLMGSEYDKDVSQTCTYTIKVGGTAPISYVELVSSLGTRRIWEYKDNKRYLELDGQLDVQTDSWFYIKVVQIDNQMAWSSPIWVHAK
ncbi:DUF3604 domain-containing protein [Vallitalea okinawensis]|uniref:DUF3604 domain-containing protein n=1 Tax=Vallitalea okinawensis TaxID=2078660 RepID=UPI000CFCA2CC|nr:DUF3604 domain-containing protein [Vallitalea okinawensis]